MLYNVKISKTKLMEIIKPNNAFDFNRITLANPEPIQSGNYFTKITLENNKPLCIQMPKCITKQGLVETKGNKYCDLMYSRNDNEELITWLEKLEYVCQDKLNEKKELWFQTELSRDDIESMMSPIMRMYQSGKYVLIRITLNQQKINGLDRSIAYNEQEVSIDLDNLTQSDSIVPLVIVNGIKFSSRSFEIDIKLSQMMIFDKQMESSCLIKCVGTETSQKNQELFKQPLEINVNKGPSVREPSVSVPSVSVPSVKEPSLKEPSVSVPSVSVPSVSVPSVKEPVLINREPLISNKDNVNKNSNSLVINCNTSSPTLEEISLDYENISESIHLKNPNEVYYEIYKAARIKAKQLRKVAMEAYLEAKEIKNKYMLSECDSSSDSSSDSEDDN